ncbi:DUF4358 domain-containing protein [Pseudoflavonifractor sp. 60]|uniref:Ig-like domain-containing protein n=1 Tax=Pseudoflavonifractor sp. 60 TaxID=2304576 RepID=UPI00136927CF|nr:DUF4358 domain-containing protein [Pseudoflavonifractor sp. 60]NBI66432.1 DUF4358 domain-containing protein [Pseudoflavonifractor sp. 60]
MKRRIFAMILASAMALSLAACGGGNNGGGSASSNPGSGSSGSSGVSSSLPDGSNPDGSNPDSSNPNGSSPDGSNPDGSGSQGDVSEPATLTLNKEKVTLNKAGAQFQLQYSSAPELPTFSSSDEKVAKVDAKGTITAVGPGTATITAVYKDAAATCTVTCSWKEETKPDTSKPSGGSGSSSGASNGSSSSSSSGSSSAAKVDLQAFYDATTGKYEFGFLELADKDILDLVYPGMSDISAEQMLVYVCMISMNNGEFGLVQVKDSKDVDAVKAVFQARVDYMVGDGNGPGGAQYPMAMDQWENNSRIVSNGNYVMMIVHENCDDIVSEFNALF